MPKYVIEREMPGAGSLSKEQLKAASQTSCGVLSTLGPQIHPFQAVSVLGSMLAAVFPRDLNVGLPAIPGEPSRSSPKHAFSGRN